MPLTQSHQLILPEALRPRENDNNGGCVARRRSDGDQAFERRRKHQGPANHPPTQQRTSRYHAVLTHTYQLSY